MVKRPVVLVVVLGLAAFWAGAELFRGSEEAIDRGVSGIDFMIPGDYRVRELDEVSYQAAVEQLLVDLEANSRVAATFTERGDRIQLLVNLDSEQIEERIVGRSGTSWVITWTGPVRERLEWARENGDLEAPGLPEPEKRNPYH